MLVIKNKPGIFLTPSVHVCAPPLPPPPTLQPQQDICYVKVGVLKNWELFFLSVTYSVLTGVRVRHLFLIPHYSQGTYEISTKKNLDPGNNHEKKFCTHENIHEKKF